MEWNVSVLDGKRATRMEMEEEKRKSDKDEKSELGKGQKIINEMDEREIKMVALNFAITMNGT